MKNKQLTIEEKIERIQNSESFEDLQTGWFPQSASTSYYFVSYCHKDYKKVFVDILDMQRYDSEIAVWYDRELNIGRDWEKEAKTHIYDFDCLGVIFYVSENSVASPAVFREMQMVKDAGKPFIPIVLPADNIRDHKGEYIYGAKLLDTLYPTMPKTDEKYKLYHEMFGEKIIFFKNTDSPQEKTERIKKSFTRLPLLEVGDTQDINGEMVDKVITAVNNINTVEVNERDFRFLDENNEAGEITGIWTCAFSNCRQLENILLPKTIEYIKEFAFYSCKKLKTVKLSQDSRLKFIGDNAFYCCENLTNITLPNSMEYIGNRAFFGCSSLTSITISDSIKSIGEAAFFGCSSLSNITIPDSVESIGNGAFGFCSSLTSVTLPKRKTKIERTAFFCCGNLTNIIFNGPAQEWNNIYKDIEEANYYLYLGINHEVIVTCTDKALTFKSL